MSNWPTNASQPLELLIATERVADQILQNKQEIVELDKRRQSSREAKRKLEQGSEKKAWVTVGPILVKMTKEKGVKLLEKGMETISRVLSDFDFQLIPFSYSIHTDQQTIDIEINKLRSEQKVLVSKLRDLEYQSPLKGFDLKPLDRQEVNAFASSNLPGF